MRKRKCPNQWLMDAQRGKDDLPDKERPMTAAERELVEQALAEPGIWMNSKLVKAIDEVRAEREAGR